MTEINRMNIFNKICSQLKHNKLHKKINNLIITK